MGSMVRCNDVVIQIAIQCARTEMRLLTVPDMGVAHCHVLQATPRTSGSLRGANQSVRWGCSNRCAVGLESSSGSAKCSSQFDYCILAFAIWHFGKCRVTENLIAPHITDHITFDTCRFYPASSPRSCRDAACAIACASTCPHRYGEPKERMCLALCAIVCGACDMLLCAV